MEDDPFADLRADIEADQLRRRENQKRSRARPEFRKVKRRQEWREKIGDLTGVPPIPDSCEACGVSEPLCLDHVHSTKTFRGWICRRCNVMLGFARDDPKHLLALAEYLKSKQ